MPANEQKFISEHGYETYGTAHEERTRREINAKFADQIAVVQQHTNAAVSHIDLYAAMECLTEAEYAAKEQAGTLEENRLYYRFPND